MKDLIEWLIIIENLAGKFYLKSSNYFKQDTPFSKLLYNLYQDEVHHAKILTSAGKYLTRTGEIIQPEVTLSDETKARIENTLRDHIQQLKDKNISKEEIIPFIYEFEFSEYSDLFIYVVNSLKIYNKRFQKFASDVENHLKIIENFLLQNDKGKNYLQKIKELPPIWEKRVLFIDDSEPILELLRSTFDNMYSVDTARDGSEGLEKIKTSYYNLILSDLKMPVMDGIKLYKQASKFDKDLKNRFLIFSGYIDDHVKEILSDLKLEYIIKPLNFDELIENIKNRL